MDARLHIVNHQSGRAVWGTQPPRLADRSGGAGSIGCEGSAGSTLFVQNEPNCPRFQAMNGELGEKRSQTKPIWRALGKAGTGTTRYAESFDFVQDRLRSPCFRGDGAVRLAGAFYAKQSQFWPFVHRERGFGGKNKPNSKPILWAGVVRPAVNCLVGAGGKLYNRCDSSGLRREDYVGEAAQCDP